MKTLIILTILFVSILGQAQETVVTVDKKVHNLYELKNPATYKLNDGEFIFIPESNDIRIKKIEDRDQVDYGQLKKTTDDGLYIMTSVLSNEVSFGRFDSLGNFRTLRYDKTKDSVLEDLFVMKVSDSIKDPQK